MFEFIVLEINNGFVKSFHKHIQFHDIYNNIALIVITANPTAKTTTEAQVDRTSKPENGKVFYG